MSTDDEGPHPGDDIDTRNDRAQEKASESITIVICQLAPPCANSCSRSVHMLSTSQEMTMTGSMSPHLRFIQGIVLLEYS